MTEFVTSIQRYGDWIKYSDEAVDFSLDNMLTVLTDEMGWSFKDFMEIKRYELFRTSKNRWFAGVDTAPSDKSLAGYKSAITKTGLVISDLPKINAFFTKNKVQGGKGNYFVALVAPEIVAEMQSIKKSSADGDYTFVELNQQQQSEIIYTGQEGKLFRFIFISSPVIEADENGYYDCLLLGKVQGKWGTTEVALEGAGAPKMIHKPIGSSGVTDALDQVGSIGWKLGGYGGLVTHDEAVMVYTCKSTLNYSEYADENRSGIRNKVTFKHGVGTTAETVTPDNVYQGGAE